MKGYLVLENGDVFEGEKIGYDKECICEVVFDTSMVGHLEVLTDPSYNGQGVCLTYPLIGNSGTITAKDRSKKISIEAIFIHEMDELSENSLNILLTENKIPGLTGINTRKLTKVLREKGTMKGMLTSDITELKGIIKKIENYEIHNLINEVISDEIKTIGTGSIRIALIDYGAKNSIINQLIDRNCEITIFPSKLKEIDVSDFDGVVLSNGPGNPAKCKKEIELIKTIYELNIPIIGIGLGHQLMAIATGAGTDKLKYGHRGASHPVKDLKRDKITITAQNHGYYIVEDSIKEGIAEVTYRNVNDGTIEGLKYIGKDIVTMQFYPESIDEFIDMIKDKSNTKIKVTK